LINRLAGLVRQLLYFSWVEDGQIICWHIPLALGLHINGPHPIQQVHSRRSFTSLLFHIPVLLHYLYTFCSWDIISSLGICRSRCRVLATYHLVSKTQRIGPLNSSRFFKSRFGLQSIDPKSNLYLSYPCSNRTYESWKPIELFNDQ